MINHADFTIVRDVMYKYSKKAQERFFTYPIESFYFAHFALSKSGQKFIESKPTNPGSSGYSSKLERLLRDTAELKD